MPTKEYRISRKVCKDEIHSGRYFSYSSLCDKVLQAGGINRVHLGETIADYLEIQQKKGVLAYYPISIIYHKLKKEFFENKDKC